MHREPIIARRGFDISTVGRREFLLAGGSCALGFWLGMRAGTAIAAGPPARPAAFDAWLRVESTGQITLLVAKAELGQGVLTALPMLLAEELDVDWEQIRVLQAPVDPQLYDHLTVGSNSVRSLWRPLRVAGATARTALIRAAAMRWNVSPQECSTRSATVFGPVRRQATYAELATAAAALIGGIADVALRPRTAFRIIGRCIPRVDAAAKVSGRAIYGADIRLPGMLRAVVMRCPAVGGTLRSFDAGRAQSVTGVRAVFAIPPVGLDAFTRGGVAVVADDTWAAIEGRRRLQTEWIEPVVPWSTGAILAALRELTAKPGAVIAAKGDVAAVLAQGARTVEATYELPFLAHACMEPMNATVDVRDDRVEAWLSTQNAADARAAIARAVQRTPASVVVHQTFVGGGFGRRDATDFVVEAAQVAAVVRRPVQLLWTREDDLQFDRFRPCAVHRMRAVLDSRGYPVAWRDRMASTPIAAFLPAPDSQHPAETEVGGARELPYDIAAFQLEYAALACPVPVGWWRSVEDSINAFAVECFVDELAAHGGIDPLAYRLDLLSGARRLAERDGASIETERLRRVLAAVAERAGWASESPAGHAKGLACHACRGSYIATVAEVSVSSGRLAVRRLWAAVDCGIAVNPLGIDAQISGGLLFGVSAALLESIAMEQGRVTQRNFNDYPLLRLPDCPRVEVVIVPSDAQCSGVGELAVPVIAPAIANALCRLTGQRIRSLPLQKFLDRPQ